jgi:hypothetical protein
MKANTGTEEMNSASKVIPFPPTTAPAGKASSEGATESPSDSTESKPQAEEPDGREALSDPVPAHEEALPDSQAALLSELLQLHDEVVCAARMSLPKAIRAGEILLGFKKKAGHGNWLQWLEDNVPFSDRTARNYMRVFEHRAELRAETISDLTMAYRLLAAPVDTNDDDDDGEQRSEANDATEDTQATAEATEEKKSTESKGKSRGTKKDRKKKFKALREAVPDDWVKTIDEEIGKFVDSHTTDCKSDPARMLALADLMRKHGAQIEEDIGADGFTFLPEDAQKSKLPDDQESQIKGTVGRGNAKEPVSQFLKKINPKHRPSIEAALKTAQN